MPSPSLTEIELQALVALLSRTPLSIVEAAWVSDFLLKHGYVPEGPQRDLQTPQGAEEAIGVLRPLNTDNGAGNPA